MADEQTLPKQPETETDSLPNGTAPGPAPVPEEILDGWRWIMEERERGTFNEYAGKHIAVLERKVLGASSDPALLREHIALKYQVDPERLVVAYIERLRLS